jgi:signal transduction histidine kinase
MGLLMTWASRGAVGWVTAGIAAEALLAALFAAEVPPFQLYGIPGAAGVLIAVVVAVRSSGRAGVVVAGVGGLLFAGVTDRSVESRLAPVPIWMAAAALAGYAVTVEEGRRRQADAARHAMLAEMLRGEQDQRRQLASDLHDDTIQVMTAALLRLDATRRRHRAAARDLTTTIDAMRAALERTRRMTFELRPPLLAEAGVRVALAELLDQTCRELGCTAHADVASERFPDAAEELVYRVVREALANVRKHAEPANVWVHVARDGAVLTGSVRDDGRGFDPGRLQGGGMRLHMGVSSMRERVALAGGRLEIESERGAGTTVRFAIPLAAFAGNGADVAAHVAKAV